MSVYVVIFVFSLISTSNAANSVSVTVLSGASAHLSCNSSFPPVWAKVNPTYKTLAINGQKHPSFNDNRFTFSKKETTYNMKISQVSSLDAGNYVCDGLKSNSFVLNVIR